MTTQEIPPRAAAIVELVCGIDDLALSIKAAGRAVEVIQTMIDAAEAPELRRRVAELETRMAVVSQAAAEPPSYKAHPVDVLVGAAIDEGSNKDRATIYAAVSSETYLSGGKRVHPGDSLVYKRIAAMTSAGLILRSASGFVWSSDEARERVEAIDFGA